jgi:hypothetical protein
MNPFLNSKIPTMDVDEVSLDDISFAEMKSNFSKLTQDAPSLIHESRHAVKVAENDFTDFSSRMKANKIEMFEIERPVNKIKI